MKMARANSAIIRRLAALSVRSMAKRTAQHWTPILGLDEWSALAMPMQATLITDTQADGPAPTRAVNLP